ncbi:MAG: DUF354 domain-containing protein [Candidatus Kapabacteria bacterium]|nr:DUF354 domain-containing protein [Candidatus Kapabacteria bacterium]
MRVWIDLDNSPHVPFFGPVVRELQRRGHEVVLTARRYAQTLELAREFGLSVYPVGRYGGTHPVGKVWSLARRALQLWHTVRPLRPEIALSHGARALVVTAVAMGIPAVVCLDYEWTERWIFRWGATRIIVPDILAASAEEAGLPSHRLRTYPGLKEEMYIANFTPQIGFRDRLGVGEETCLVILRPPSTTANYRTPRTFELFETLLLRIREESSVVALVLPRDIKDWEWVERVCRRERIGNVQLLPQVVPGLQLLYWADMVISGGGTMNREAALLGSPTYSIFAGRLGAVDRWLREQGKLTILGTEEEIARLHFVRHQRAADWSYPDKGLASVVASFVEEEYRSSHSRCKASGGMTM